METATTTLLAMAEHHRILVLVAAAGGAVLWLLATRSTTKKYSRIIKLTRVDEDEDQEPDDPSVLALPHPPLAPGAYPILGHLPAMAQHKSDPTVLMTQLVKSTGPIYMLQLGAARAVVISDAAIAREALRHRSLASRMLTPLWHDLTEGGRDLALAPFGAHWQRIRRAAHKVLGSAPTLENDPILHREADRFMSYLLNKSGTTTFDLLPLLQRYTANVIFAKGLGVAFESLDDPELSEILVLVRDMFAAVAVGDPTEYLSASVAENPFVKPVFNWLVRDSMAAMKRMGDRFHNGFVKNQVDLAVRRATTASKTDVVVASATENADTGATPYVDTLVRAHLAGDADALDLQQIKLLLSDMLVAGLDTTAGSLMWIAVYLVNHPAIQASARAEIASHIAATGVSPSHLTLADMSALPMVRAIVKETLRIQPVAQLGLPRMAGKAAEIRGYCIPRGAQIIINVQETHASMWASASDAATFRPDRWLSTSAPADNDVDKVAGEGSLEVPGSLLAFGAGRRICPGMPLAVREMTLVTARLLAAGTLAAPPGVTRIDPRPVFGLTCVPVGGTLVRFVPSPVVVSSSSQ
ncbi:cytochrome P450 [Blastocladiella britannica]|nr:cytochrome P450 [Blastocladiella britannica]